MAIGDLNRDGRPDLAVGCYGFFDEGVGGVSVFFNQGSGHFSEGAYYLDDDQHLVTSVAIDDLNGDGTADLVASSDGPLESLSVLLNRGDGSLLAPVEYAAGDATSVAIGDLNGDGRPDLVAASSYGRNSVSVLLNRGDGTFQAKHDYQAGKRIARSVSIGDLNGDGKPDLVSANEDEDSVSVLLNRGDGTFEAKRSYQTGHAYDVAIGDLNGDGKPDLVSGSSLLLNRGDGTFKTKRKLPEPGGDAIGDLNGDGLPDIATSSASARGVSVLLNRGAGRFQSRLEYSSGRGGDSMRLAIGDLNGDGRLDLAVTNTNHRLQDDEPSDLAVLINTPGLCNVQYVRGMTVAAARRTLPRVNCRLGKVRRTHSKRVKKGRVILQKPRFGVVLPGGSKVNLVVSLGRKG